MSAPIPEKIRLLRKSQLLELTYPSGEVHTLSFEFLRVHSPSAEVKGHGPGTEVLQHGKRGVDIVSIEPVGNYAAKIHFSDGHNSGLYDWELLYEFCQKQESLWLDYLYKLEKAGKSRDR